MKQGDKHSTGKKKKDKWEVKMTNKNLFVQKYI